jgi:RNA polymerase sigma-70 factor (family 1)
MKAANSNSPEDKLLLLNLKEDSIEAFNALYEKYWENVYSDALKRSHDEDYAKDITQDVFLQLWTRRNELNISNLPAYLFVAVRNNVFKWMEKEDRYIPIPELLIQIETAKDQADSKILLKEFLKAYESLIETLTPSQQEIFRMRYHQDLSTKEISSRLNISRKTVQNQLAKSLALLRHSLMLSCILLLITSK